MDIEKYVEESLRCAEEDQAFKDLIQTRNSFESNIYGKKRAIEKKMDDNKVKNHCLSDYDCYFSFRNPTVKKAWNFSIRI